MTEKRKYTLYFIGGPSRAGKTAAALRLMRRKRLVFLPTDMIRAVVRNTLTGESYVSLDEITFAGSAKLHRPGETEWHGIEFSESDRKEDDLTWKGMLGIIETLDRKGSMDALIEGIAVTPQRVSRLKLKNLDVRAVFVGYGNESHLAPMLAYSRKHDDWLQTWIEERDGDDSHVRAWLRKGVSRSKVIEGQAKKFGYEYFDITERPFREHVQAVVDYLLER